MASLSAEVVKRVFALTMKKPLHSPEELTRHLRGISDRLAWLPAPLPRGIRRVEARVGGVAGTWHEPSRPVGTLLYLHGGAFVCGLNPFYHRLAGILARQLNYRVFLADYRLAPEHPFPAATDDALAAYRGIAELDGGGPLAIAGDSAGGHLTLVTLQSLRAAGLRLPDCAVALSPLTGKALELRSHRANARTDCMISSDLIREASAAYFTHATPDPRQTPLDGDFSGLPPLLFVVSDSECLRDDSYAALVKARAQGVNARLLARPDLPHVWPVFHDLMPEARRDLAEIVQFIQRHAIQPLRKSA